MPDVNAEKVELIDDERESLLDDMRYGSSSDLFATVKRIIAARVAEAGPDAIRAAADNLYLTGPGQHNEHTASWLHRRANLLDPRTREAALIDEERRFPPA